MKLFLLIVVLLFSVNSALGCSYLGYPNPPINYIAANTGKIFLGRVVSKSSAVQIEDDYKYRVYRIKLRVEKSIKGVSENEIYWVRVTESINQRTSCSTDAPKFKKGELWVIQQDFNKSSDIERFVNGPGIEEFSQYTPAVNAGYIESLEKAVKNPVTAIYGQIQGFRIYSSTVEFEVILEGNGLKLKTKTNKDGEYSFENLPAGNYQIKIPLPRKTRDYFNDKATFFSAENQTHNLEYDVLLKSGDSHYQFTVLSEFFFQNR